jgi:hypothetical protein
MNATLDYRHQPTVSPGQDASDALDCGGRDHRIPKRLVAMAQTAYPVEGICVFIGISSPLG